MHHHILYQIFHPYNAQIVTAWIRRYGYLFIFLGTVLEGELVMLISGFLSYAGALNFWLVFIFGFLGAALGDNIWYYVGVKGGTHFINRYGKIFFLTAARVKRAKGYFDNHGSKTVFFSRFIFGTRISSAILAGAFSMPKNKFLRSNLLGACVWAFITTCLGYVFGNSFELLHHYLRQTELSLLILGIIAIIIVLLRFFVAE